MTGTPVWLATEPEAIYGVLHMPARAVRTRTAVLMLPTFGWDDDCSYRARRDWATRFAEADVAAARIDLPGSENSVGSPLTPGRVQSWIEATAGAASWLRQASGCERLVALGIGLGGLIAYQATAQGAPIEDLILWATRASGRAYLRELRAYAMVAAGDTGDAPEPPRSDGVIGIAGHPMTQETAEALSAIDLAEVPLPDADRRRVLLIGRDAQGVDRKLRGHLADSGADLTILDADDYHRLMALPDFRLTPIETIKASVAWVNDQIATAPGSVAHSQPPAAPSASDSVEFVEDDVRIRERICELQTTAGRLVTIVSEPVGATRAPYCLVAVNSGELRHTGPNRMLVEIARRAAACGVPTARVDLPGLGDSDGDSVRTFERTQATDAEALAVLDEVYDQLERLHVAERFVPVGLCLGAYLAIRAVLSNNRTIGTIAINPPAFRWTNVQRSTLRRGLAAADPDVVNPPGSRERLPRPLRSTAQWIENGRRSVELRARRRLAHWKVLWRFVRRAVTADASQTLDRFADTGVRVLLLLSEDESVLRLLEQPKLATKLAGSPNVRVEQLPTHDHILRPLRSQERALDRITVALRDFLPLGEPNDGT